MGSEKMKDFPIHELENMIWKHAQPLMGNNHHMSISRAKNLILIIKSNDRKQADRINELLSKTEELESLVTEELGYHKELDDQIEKLESKLENQYEIERDLRKRIDYLSL